MAVFAREAFLKGTLFRMGTEAGILDRDRLCQVSVKWILSHPQITSVVVGIDTPEQLACQIDGLSDGELRDADLDLLQKLRKTPTYESFHAGRTKDFLDPKTS